MSSTKQSPSTLLSIGEIYTGTIQEQGEFPQFVLDGNVVPRVRIFGVVIDRYDGVSRSGREFCSLTIDDGTDTIRATVWSRPIEEDGIVVYDPIDIVEGIEIGDIVDVLGRVQEYQETIFVSPSNIAVKDIEWEIHRRTELIKGYLQQHNLLTDERDIFGNQSPAEPELSEPKTPSEPPVEAPPEEPPSTERKTVQSDEDIQSQVLEVMSDDYKQNTVENLAQQMDFSPDVIRDAIQALLDIGSIYEREEKRYAKLSAPI